MSKNLPQLRICFLGESFVNGIGDPECLGWAGRICVNASQKGYDITYYNLGVRRGNICCPKPGSRVDLAVSCYSLTQNFPASEIYGLTSQIRRSAVSVASNIAAMLWQTYQK